MFETVALAKAVLVAAVMMRLVAWGAPRPWRRDSCWSWAIGAGVLAASGATDQWPHWPAFEDRARFLTLLVPLTLGIETLAAILPSRGLAWVARVSLAIVTAPILLHNSVYLAQLNGRDSAEWSLAEATVVLGGLAALLAIVWTLLSSLERRTSTRSVQGVLILDALATAVTVMLSGYYGAGLLGLGLAGAIAGATLAASAAPPSSSARGSLGMSVIGIFAVVIMGRFFGTLSTGLAACLLLAPLVAWTIELPWLRKLGSAWRAAGRLACVAIPLLVVLIVAQRKFTAASVGRSRAFEPSATADRVEK
jgi:hypothetical protein